MADEGGLGSLSMRRLAKELGVEAMSLYHHVRSKDDIQRGLIGLVVDEIELPPPGEPWKPALRRIALSYRKALARHPWAPGVMFTHTDALPGRIRYMETMLRTLAEAGFSAEITDLAYHTLESHIMGFTLWAASFRGLSGRLEELARDFLKDLPEGEHPHLIQHVHHHLKPPAQPRSAFEFGLDLILDGLEQLPREAARPADAAVERG